MATNTNILITGIAGFIGSACAEFYLNKGYQVIGIVKDKNHKTRKDILDRCSIVQGDILDKETIRYAMSRYEADYVLHLASQPIVRICDNDPYTAYMTNIVGSLNVMDSIRELKKKPKKVVAISSDKAYGPTAKLPYKEDSELVVADTYCTSKACQDMIYRSYAKTYSLPIVTVRAGNIYGNDLNLSRLIPQTIMRLLDAQPPVIYSGVYDYVREFIYVDDIVSAFDILLCSGIPGEAYNVGGTPPQKIGRVIEIIRDKINPLIPINTIQKDFYEIKEQYLDASKLKALGWKANIDLSTGLDKTIEWFRKYGVK